MFLWTTIKVVYYTRKENRERKERQKMHPDMETVRRDSKLAAIIEEYHLKTMHRLILKLLQPLSGGNLQKMVRPKRFFQADVFSKKQTNEFYFTTMKPQVNLFSFGFWRKLKTPKRHFEII